MTAVKFSGSKKSLQLQSDLTHSFLIRKTWVTDSKNKQTQNAEQNTEYVLQCFRIQKAFKKEKKKNWNNHSPRWVGGKGLIKIQLRITYSPGLIKTYSYNQCHLPCRWRTLTRLIKLSKVLTVQLDGAQHLSGTTLSPVCGNAAFNDNNTTVFQNSSRRLLAAKFLVAFGKRYFSLFWGFTTAFCSPLVS